MQVLQRSASAQLTQRQRSSAGCSTSLCSASELLRSKALTPRTDVFKAIDKRLGAQKWEASRSIVCGASVLTKQPLSIYNWPRPRPAVLEWLDHCVQDAVRQLDRAPFVQLTYSERSDKLETHHVPQTSAGSYEFKQKVAGLLLDSKPDAVVLVHRLPSQTKGAKATATQAVHNVSASNVVTGMSSHPPLDEESLRHPSTEAQNDILNGKIGECCDDASVQLQNQIVPFSRSHAEAVSSTLHSSQAAAQHSRDSSAQAFIEQTTDYWGLVVQSKYRSEAEGYYILKTVRNVNPVGCQCTHYSLTRF